MPGSSPALHPGLNAGLKLSADRERFMPWRPIEGETLAPASQPQLEVLIKGMFPKLRRDCVHDHPKIHARRAGLEPGTRRRIGAGRVPP